MRLSGVVAPFTFAGGMDTAAMQTYVKRVLVPELRPGDIVIWDNLKPHQDAEVVRGIKQAGASVEPLPPWSPDLTPIEKMYSKVKGFLRAIGARTKEAVIEAMGAGLEGVSLFDIKGWFQSCGIARDDDRNQNGPNEMQYGINLAA
jgi:transposase